MKCEIATCALIDVYLLYLKKKKKKKPGSIQFPRHISPGIKKALEAASCRILNLQCSAKHKSQLCDRTCMLK